MEDIFLQNFIGESFKVHLFIEFYYHHAEGKLFLLEQGNANLDENVLLEQYGVFPGCKQLALRLLEIAKENHDRQNANVKVNNLPWLKHIKLILNYPVGEAAYAPSETVFVSNKVRSINIYLNKNIIGTTDALPLLMHELTHAYEDYQLRLKGTSLNDELLKKGYDKNQVGYDADNSISEKKKRELKYNLSWVLYHLNDFERSAYITQITSYLDNCGQHFNTINDVYNYLKSTQIYQNYEAVFEWSEELISLGNDELKEFILQEVKNLSNYNFTNYGQFAKWLKNKLYNYKNKFNTILPKIAYSHLTMARSLIQPTSRSIRR